MSNSIQVETLAEDKAWMVRNFLSSEECEELISFSESEGFTEAPITVGEERYVMMPDIRNNRRVIWDNIPFAEKLYNRIESHIPKNEQVFNDSRERNKWSLIGLNERFRFYKYLKGMYFRPHQDGCFARRVEKDDKTFQQVSFLTCIIYLNDVQSGGHTSFYLDRGSNEASFRVEPRQGSVLLFKHRLLHEGSELEDEDETKYVIRTDVMYESEIKSSSNNSSSSTKKSSRENNDSSTDSNSNDKNQALEQEKQDSSCIVQKR